MILNKKTGGAWGGLGRGLAAARVSAAPVRAREAPP